MTLSVINILDMVEAVGDEKTRKVLSGFSTAEEADSKPLNSDIELFLKKNAIQFAKERKSITYLVCNEEQNDLLGYFTLTHKSIEISASGLSKTTIRKLEKHSKLNQETNTYSVSAFLIAQFGKNYNIDEKSRISGDELMYYCEKELAEIRYRIGGNVEYLDCEADANLIRFYQDQQNFTLFGERLSENDGKRYLQYMRFLKQ